MSQEPPRVNFSGPSFSKPQPAGGRTKSSTGRVVAIIFGILFLFLFLCSGAAVVTYRRFESNSNFGGSYSELREPIGGAIPERVRDTAEQATIADSDEADEITEWLESGMAEVDKSRFVMEMQRSGLSSGMINPFTRVFWSLDLDDAIVPVELGERVAVLDFEWLVEGKEARAVVASASTYGDDSSVHVLYLTRTKDEWKLFDWREVLLPMNESQYWAIYAGLGAPQDSSYSDFTYKAYEISLNGPGGNPERIKKLMSTYKATKFPSRYVPLAQDLLCEWLVRLNAKDELAEMVKQLDTNEFAGAWFYKAKSAAWSNDIEQAFQHLTELRKQVGWHPKAVHLAAEIAVTPEQKRIAAEWLQRTALLLPINYTEITQYFKLADREQMDSLFEQIAKSKRPVAHIVKLVESLGYLSHRQLQMLADLTKPYDELKDAHLYLELKSAVNREDHASVQTLAPKFLRLDSMSDQYAINASALSDFIDAAIELNSLKQAADQVPDKDAFWMELRDRAAYGFYELPAKDTAAILDSIPRDHELFQDTKTPIAIARMVSAGGNASEAFDSLLEIYKSNESQLTSDEPIDFSGPLLDSLGESALASDRWRELIDVVDNEVLFLMLAGNESIKPDQMQQVLKWYEATPDHAALWPNYFRARSAFKSGDWPAADRFIVEAIRFAKLDSRVSVDSLDSLPPLVAMLASDLEYDEYTEYDEYESDLSSNWIGTRFSYAARCNALDRLVADAQVADEINVAWVTHIRDYFEFASTESQEKIAALLKATDIEDAQKLSEEIRNSLSISRGKFAEAFASELARAKGMETGSWEQKFAVKSAGTQLLKSGDATRIDSLRQVGRTAGLEPYVECVAATLNHDIPALCKSLELWDVAEWRYQNFIDLDVLKVLQGVPNLRDATAVQPIDFDLIRYSVDDCELILSADPDQAATAFEEFLKSKSISYSALDKSRFHRATAAFEIKTAEGEFVVTFSRSSTKAFAENSITDMFAKEARGRVVFTRKDTVADNFVTRQIALRTTINGMLEGLPSAIALHDTEATSVFCGEGWQKRFGQSLQTGIDLSHPEQCHELYKESIFKPSIELDGKTCVFLGQARELIPVNFQTGTSNWEGDVGLTQAPSILVPDLPADVFVETDR